MTQKDREIQCMLRILKHAEETGHVGRTCRYFGIGRASFYRRKTALEKHGEAGLVRRKPIPKNPKNRMSPEIVEKVLYHRELEARFAAAAEPALLHAGRSERCRQAIGGRTEHARDAGL